MSPAHRLTTEQFIERARKEYGDKYDYSKVEYIKRDIPVCIIHPVYGDFWQTPTRHILSKYGRPKGLHIKGMKRCYRCKKQVNICNFGKNKSKKDGMQPYCNECRTEYNNTEAQKFHMKEYYNRPNVKDRVENYKYTRKIQAQNPARYDTYIYEIPTIDNPQINEKYSKIYGYNVLSVGCKMCNNQFVPTRNAVVARVGVMRKIIFTVLISVNKTARFMTQNHELIIRLKPYNKLPDHVNLII